MSLNRKTTRTFHRTLYAGILQSITVLKRGDNQQQGVVRAVRMHQCRQSKTFKRGQTLGAGELLSSHMVTWHIPVIEMERVGIEYFSPTDQIVEDDGKTWQPESTTQITIKLFANHWCLDCLRIR